MEAQQYPNADNPATITFEPYCISVLFYRHRLVFALQVRDS